MTKLPVLSVVIVHFRSGGTIQTLSRELVQQDHPNLEVVIVECGDDGSTSAAREILATVPTVVVDPGANVGYCGGNNLGISRRRPASDVLIVNPDVSLPEPGALRALHAALLADQRLAAVGPLIRTPEGLVEHADSFIDDRRAMAIHTRTSLPSWPDDLSQTVHFVPWLDGCCWLVRSAALDAIGGLDERFFLYCEEVDWSRRATDAGWSLGIVPSVAVQHARSSSFQTTQKGSYYYWRNNYLLFRKHAASRKWIPWWLRRLIRFSIAPRHIRTGAAANALWGGFDAIRGRTGPRPGRGRA